MIINSTTQVLVYQVIQHIWGIALLYIVSLGAYKASTLDIKNYYVNGLYKKFKVFTEFDLKAKYVCFALLVYCISLLSAMYPTLLTSVWNEQWGYYGNSSCSLPAKSISGSISYITPDSSIWEVFQTNTTVINQAICSSTVGCGVGAGLMNSTVSTQNNIIYSRASTQQDLYTLS